MTTIPVRYSTRKKIKIASTILLAIYFLIVLLPIKTNIDELLLAKIVMALLVPGTIYELIQKRKDDKANNTHTLKNMMWMVVAGAVFVFACIVVNKSITN